LKLSYIEVPQFSVKFCQRSVVQAVKHFVGRTTPFSKSRPGDVVQAVKHFVGRTTPFSKSRPGEAIVIPI
jgi:hypothetical protein